MEPTPIINANSDNQIPDNPPSAADTVNQAKNNLVELRLKISKRTLLFIGGFIFISLLVILIGTWLIIFQANPSPNNQSQDNTQNTSVLAGEIALAEGQIHISSAEEWLEAQPGQPIKQGDSIKTGPNSRAVINLDDGSAVRLDQSSHIKLATLTSKTIIIEQVSGRAYHRVEPGQLTYQVKTPQATTTALGTIFSTANTQTDDTIYVLESKVRVQPKTPMPDLSDNHVEVSTGNLASVTPTQLKVDAINQESLKEDFYIWNSALDKGQPIPSATPTPTATPEPTKTSTPAPNQSASIILTNGGVGPGKATLTWKLTGVSAPQGFKIIKSHSGTPTFGKDEAVYISGSNATSYTWTNLHNKPTYFRVGIYNGSGISLYSNTITVTPQVKPLRPPYSGSISLSTPTIDGHKVNLSWSATKQEQVDGWKVVYSTSPNPTYPDDTANYASAGDKTTGFKDLPSGTYYFRVGAWIDGKVASNAYSNQVQITIP